MAITLNLERSERFGCTAFTQPNSCVNLGLKADMIFIDAEHTYEACQSDIYAFSPLLKDGGILCGHDYWQGAWPGVTQAVDEIFGANACGNAGTTIWSTRRRPKHNIYQCMMFNNEFEILEKNLETMWNVVDRFVIMEATVSHSGKPKPLHFKENIERFPKYLPKISHVIVEDSPNV